MAGKKRNNLGVLALVLVLFSPTISAADEAHPFRPAMDAASAGDWVAAAQSAADQGEIARDLIEWQRLRAGQGTFADYRAFLDRRADWPGLPLLRAQGERSITGQEPASQIVAYFAPQLPRTGHGSLRLAAALTNMGAAAVARSELRRAWLTLALNPSEQGEFLSAHAEIIAPLHAERLANLIWDRHFISAAAMKPLVDRRTWALADARIDLMQGKSGVDEKIEALEPDQQADPGLAHARFEWRMGKGLFDSAADLLAAQSRAEAGLGRASKWGRGRLRLARDAAQEGRWAQSYDLAAGHGLKEGSDYAAAEWQAGFAALVGLNRADLALGHFRRFRVAVFTPISLGRAGYWEGRALDALGRPADARQAYEFAAEYQTSFYGQLAAIHLGMTMDEALAGLQNYPDLADTSLADSTVLAAANLAADAGFDLMFRRFLRHLAERANAGELGALGDLALAQGNPYAALYLAKYAAQSATVLPRAYYPIPDKIDGPFAVPNALVLAVARRESEFNTDARSRAGARGLMQLMPATAQLMGKELNLPVATDDLTANPALNLTLGAGYLARLEQEFAGYLPAMAAGYNAGPGNARKWLAASGGPPRTFNEAINWIELIPFSETRNYVMRVLESREVYRARLTGAAVPWDLDRALVR